MLSVTIKQITPQANLHFETKPKFWQPARQPAVFLATLAPIVFAHPFRERPLVKAELRNSCDPDLRQYGTPLRFK